MKAIKLFLKLNWKEKCEVIQCLFNNYKERFIDYWLGNVSVIDQDIYDDGVKKLYTYSIIAGQYGKGVWFSDLKASDLPKVIEKVKESQGKKFNLYVSYGCGVSNEYTFNKRLTRLLLNLLLELNKREIYIDEYEKEECD